MTDTPKTTYGPHNPHPLSQMRTELVWEGKYDEFGNRREVDHSNLFMPLQRIESIDEPLSRAKAQGSLFDENKAHRDDFRNKLIWGDNRLVAASLLPEYSGAIDLIYIDPPFDVGADFAMTIPVGETTETLDKTPSIIEMVAYRDMWGRGIASYLTMLHDRLLLFKELLSENGSIFVHCDWRMTAAIRLLLDDIFGRSSFGNEIIWKRQSAHSGSGQCGTVHDTIYFYHKTPNYIWNKVLMPASPDYIEGFFDQIEETTGRRYARGDLTGAGRRSGETGKPWRGRNPDGKGRHWAYRHAELDEFEAKGLIHWPKSESGMPRLKRYADEFEGVILQDVWTDIKPIHNQSAERVGYDTQKPEKLVERIVLAASNENSLVADFFCGSGTLPGVAERLGRRWVAADLGRFSIHTTRKRLIGLQRELHTAARPYRSFDLFNLGRYERQWWQKEAPQGAEEEHRGLVLRFFRAEVLKNTPSPLLHGRKNVAFVHVDGIDSILTRGEVSDVAKAVKEAGGKEVHCLAWDFEMDLRQSIVSVETELEVRVRLHRIPREIMEKNRSELPPFFEIAVLQADPVVRSNDKGKTVDIKLSNFLPSLTEVPSKELEALQERAIQSGFDFIDFWAIDFDWHPDQPFNHHWQDYRTRKNRSLKTISDAEFSYSKPGKHTACVKVVDVFGCDTSITVEVET